MRKGVGVAVVIMGAEIVREYEGAYTNLVVYRQRCDSCGYFPLRPPISVSILPHSAVAHGIYHAESFVCPFCGNRQIVEIQG